MFLYHFSVFALQFSNVYMQTNGSDCGLYAIANATALAFGKAPSRELYIQSKLSEHLIQCLKDIEMRPFPTAKVTSKKTNCYQNDRKLAVILCLQNSRQTHLLFSL